MWVQLWFVCDGVLVLVAAVVTVVIMAMVAVIEMVCGHVVAALESVAVVVAQAAGHWRMTEELGAVGVWARALLEVTARGLNAVMEAATGNIGDDVIGRSIPAAMVAITITVTLLAAISLLATVALLRRRRAVLLCVERKGRGCAHGQHQKRRGKT